MDGVLLPDYNHIVGLGDRDFFVQTLYAKPMFSPAGRFDVVTARLECWRDITEQWLKQLREPPVAVFMRSSEDESPAQFKYRIAVERGYTKFVESDPQVCREMNKLIKANFTNLHVIHFDDYLSKSFRTS